MLSASLCRRPSILLNTLWLAVPVLLCVRPALSAELPALLQQSHQYLQRIDQHPPSGDIDHDFATFLVPQHLTGVGLSEAEIHDGQNPQLRAIASGILAHRDRNAPVSSQVSPLPATDPRYQQEKQLLQAADNQARQAFRQPLNGDADRQFNWLMAAHHQRAIGYATAELKLGRDPALLKLARGMIQQQKQQHRQMMTLLKS
ncbi:DUF305 domain-containing protein [Tatumella saanichensis]|uniref:DUF305 domain-containing protein n=1 Tax=Tatumella saanichensis TaxID=480813 RepID=UPI0004B9F101|nr:DUF305 domain-containing protein [Tatumella saanichensis]